MVLILLTVAGVFLPDLLPIVTRTISLLGTKIV